MTPLDIITEDSWEHGLFTTYALSLSFYETQLHKLGLARNGCRDIQIIADVDGYELSLGERQSHRVGNEYRLIPACLPSGVFHPKLTWLAGKRVDLLLLGSGNLTFGGFGKNHECLNVVRSDTNGAVFSAVGEMLAQWSGRDDLRFAEEGWLDFWRERAQRVSVGLNVSENPARTLIHSTVESVADQIVRRIGGQQTVVEVRCLSPFFDPDGDGILSLAESLNASKLTIGLLPGQEANSSFPFGELRQTRVEIEAAMLADAEAKRKLHAKVFEFHMDDGSRFVLTGSVNATRKSLLTTDNIETALLSVYPGADSGPFEWTPVCLPSSYRRQDFRKAGLGGRVVVSARLTGDGRIEGNLLARLDPSGVWSGSLQRIDGVVADMTLSVDASGDFSVQLNEPDLFQHAAGLQLSVAKGTRSGTGWVNVEGLLMAARRGFLSPATLIRLLGTDADENDEAELLRYLSVSAQRHLPAFSDASPRRTGKHRAVENEPESDAPPVRIPIEWLTQASHMTQGARTHGDDQDPESATLNAYIRSIRQNLLQSPGRESQSEDTDESSDDSASKREEKERLRRQGHVQQSLLGFDENMKRLVDATEPGSKRSAALCMWLEVKLPILLRRLSEPDQAKEFLGRWLVCALSGQRRTNSSETLTHHLLSGILTLAAVQLQTASPKMAKSLARLHEQLEDFCEDADPRRLCEDLEVIGDSVRTPLSAEILQSLPDAPDLSMTLSSLLGTPTVRSQIQTILSGSADDSTGVAEGLPVLALPAGRRLKKLVDAGRTPKTKTLGLSAKSCPHCYMKLRRATYSEINRDRFSFCSDCGNLLLASV